MKTYKAETLEIEIHSNILKRLEYLSRERGILVKEIVFEILKNYCENSKIILQRGMDVK